MFACLHAPNFSCQAALRAKYADAQNRFEQSPVVVLGGPANLLKVVAFNRPARKAGIKMGMTKLQVENCGGVSIHKRVTEHETLAHGQLLACAKSFSPSVESTSPGTVLLDLSGTEKLFGRPQVIARKISHEARMRGFVANIAIASNPDAALYSAKGFSGITVAPRGKEAITLSCLGVDLLPAPPEVLETLDGWGIRTFKDFAELPAIGLTQRLGQTGLYLQRLAQGRVIRGLLPTESSKKFIESYEFDDPVETLESLIFVFNWLLQRLSTKLLLHSLATSELRLVLQLEVRQNETDQPKGAIGGEQYQHSWKLPFPTQDNNVLSRLLQLDLERQTFAAPIKKISIEGIPTKPRISQGNLFAPSLPEAEKLEVTLARIRGIIGVCDANAVKCVGAPKVLDTYKPDSFTLDPFLTAGASDFAPVRPIPFALRMFRPALETSVKFAGASPLFVHLWSGHRRVIAASGPWLSSGNWWNKALAWAREEWDVALKTQAGIGLYRIYQDQMCGQWFVEGMFD